MTSHLGEYLSFTGSQPFASISDTTGLPVDQINFLACQFSALALGYPFRVFLGPHAVSPTLRHIFATVVGLAIILFLVGLPTVFLLAQTLSCYFLMLVLPNRWMPHTVTLLALLQLSISHIWYQVYYYHNTVGFDISGPLMINTQRVTSLAWSVYDGRVKDEDKLPNSLKRLAVRKTPSFLEILSYTFCFHSVIFGPFCFFSDYIAHIEGTNLQTNHKTTDGSTDHRKFRSQCPSPSSRVIERLMSFVVCAAIMWLMAPAFSVRHLSDHKYQNSGFLSKIIYLEICTTIHKAKYYTVFKLGEAVTNNAGLGFYQDEKGEPKWDLVDNVNILKTEFATNIRMFLANWNIMTSKWMRHIAFERLTSMKTFSVFLLSSIWHGFYPGFYLTGAGSAIFVAAARKVRRQARPHFLTEKWKHQIYDVLTFLATRISISYMGFPFLMQELFSSLEVYRSFYFFWHIIAVAVIVVLSCWPKQGKDKKKAH